MMRVMVVEDEEMIRRGIVMAVDWAALDCIVVGEAANGEQALAVAEDCQPTLIITDLKMPKMDGLEFVTWLEELDPSLGCMLLTAQQDDAMRDHRDHPSLLFRMQKPTSFPVLSEALAKIVAFTQSHRCAGESAA